MRWFGRPLSRRSCQENTTSSAVTGLPSEKRAAGLSVKVTMLRAASVSTVWASRP